MGAPLLVLGPSLRYVGEDCATVWVETSGPCEVEVLGHRARTFHVEGHHYAVVIVEGLAPATSHPYEVALDGVVRWPERNTPFPPSTIRTYDRGRRFRLLFGSCRAAAPHVSPFTLARDEHELARGVDALYAYAMRMRDQPPEEWPDALLELGDQVYADELHPATRDFILARRDASHPPGTEVADFEEYTYLYRESWSEPVIRWFRSTVPSAMIFDDHDVNDDWNISAAWVEEVRRLPWWRDRIVGALMSYWIYQHLGNLTPDELRENELLRRVQGPEDAGPILREFAYRADREPNGTRWSFQRDFGSTRLVVMDSRAGRVLDGDLRQMVDDGEWEWIQQQVKGGFDHLLLASSLPVFLPRATHGLEAWNEAVCAGAWGGRAARAGEWLRRKIDLEHWAAFGRSFRALCELVVEVAAGRRGPAPATIVFLSGDVHFAYLARLELPPGTRSRGYQAVCSPIRNPVPAKVRRGQRFSTTRAALAVGLTLERLARVERPPFRWEITHGPWFDNELCTLDLDGRSAVLRMEHAPAGRGASPRLEPVYEAELSREA